MNRKEAIEHLKDIKKYALFGNPQNKALDIAIKALEQEPISCQSCKHLNEDTEICLECEYDGTTRGMTKYEEQEPCEDAISRQAAIEAMYKMHMNGKEGVLHDLKTETGSDAFFAETIADAVEALEELPSVNPQPKWIPVSERLPEENGYYLTTTMYHEVYCDYWEEDHFNRTEAVIAWMPLPEPYKAESEE